MRQLNKALGIAFIISFFFYLTREVSSVETDLDSLSSIGYVEFIDGRLFFTILDTLSQEDVKVLRRVESIFELHIIDLEEENGNNPYISTRDPP